MRKLVKSAKIPKDQVQKNFSLVLNILYFQTKVRFEAVEEMKRKVIERLNINELYRYLVFIKIQSMQTPAIPAPKSSKRPTADSSILPYLFICSNHFLLGVLISPGNPNDIFKVIKEEGTGYLDNLMK
jgi:hypothetical protein